MAGRDNHTVRIIAGEFRGRRLVYPARRILRPTMDRTREALFSSIQGRLPGARFADLFCAAGGVGIEALSRGADRVEFVENQPAALDCLRKNLEQCRVSPDRYAIYDQDVFEYLESGRPSNSEVNIMFADPPYDTDDAKRLLDHLTGSTYDHLELFILEHRDRVDVGSPGNMSYTKTKKFGESRLSYWEQV
jgi:16S rRNA (guanine966-N2)-methyltransferase